MELVVDSNRIIAALVKDGKSRDIILSRRFSLYTIDFGVKEVQKYKALIKKKAKINEQGFNFLMNGILAKIAVVSEKDVSKASVKRALKIMEEIDENDVPFIALAIDLGNKAVWSDDKHFKKQKEVKVYTTKELAGKL